MTTSNIDEVNRLLAESDSSSEDDAIGGVASDQFMQNLIASRKERETSTEFASKLGGMPTTKPQQSNISQRTSSTFSAAGSKQPLANISAKMNAEEILNAVSSDSDEDDAEVAKLMRDRLNAATQGTGAGEEKKNADYDFYL